jgi:hypothetical protein
LNDNNAAASPKEFTDDRASALCRVRQLTSDQRSGWTAAGRAAEDVAAARRRRARIRLGPAQGLPGSARSPALYDEAKKNGWTVISMKNDWKRIFAFE